MSNPSLVPDRRPKRADLGSVTREYVKAMGWSSVNLHTHISLVNRYLYVEVPKAGCGTMKATLGSLEAARQSQRFVERVQDNPHDRSKATPFVKPFQLPPDLLEEAFAGSSFTRFTVVREPASRLLSGYLEKIRQGLKQSGPIIEVLRERGVSVDSAQDITLAQFVDAVGSLDSRAQDPHWRRQVDHLGLGIVDYDAVIHLEDLDRSWERIGELVGVTGLAESYYCRNSTGASGKVAERYTPDLLAQVASIYADDYRVLAYEAPTL